MSTQTKNQVAREILNQLGGNKFLAMTGTYNLIAGDNYLLCKLRRNSSKANYLKIELNSMDLYDLTFSRVHGIKITEIEKIENIYNDMLQSIFTKVTGLDTHL